MLVFYGCILPNIFYSRLAPDANFYPGLDWLRHGLVCPPQAEFVVNLYCLKTVPIETLRLVISSILGNKQGTSKLINTTTILMLVFITSTLFSCVN